jgi:hypothetical protein
VVGIVVAVVAVVVAAGSVLAVYRIGESGAQAAWTGQFSDVPLAQQGSAPATSPAQPAPGTGDGDGDGD